MVWECLTDMVVSPVSKWDLLQREAMTLLVVVDRELTNYAAISPSWAACQGHLQSRR